jgi:hypothetical protein
LFGQHYKSNPTHLPLPALNSFFGKKGGLVLEKAAFTSGKENALLLIESATIADNAALSAQIFVV